MEEGLCRLLEKVGLVFRAIGEAVDYFGLVTPYWASVDALEHGYDRSARTGFGPPPPAFRFPCVYARAPLAFEEAGSRPVAVPRAASPRGLVFPASGR